MSSNNQLSPATSQEKQTTLTSNEKKVVERIKSDQSITFIAIGEIHNSLSAIEFITKNRDVLFPKDRTNYLLTEFLPPEVTFKKDKNNFLSKWSKYLQKEKRGNGFSQLNHDTTERSKDKPKDEKGVDEKLYFNFYRTLYDERDASIISIEDPSTYGKKELHKKIQAGDLESYRFRVDLLNSHAANLARKCTQREGKPIRIVVFAGMGHIANSTVLKGTSEKKMEGIAEQLLASGLRGLSINIHNPALCHDQTLLKNIFVKSDCYTKWAKKDTTVTVESPHFLLFLSASQQQQPKKIDESMESIFLPGSHSLEAIENEENRHTILKANQSQKLAASENKTTDTPGPLQPQPLAEPTTSVAKQKKKKKKKKNKPKQGAQNSSSTLNEQEQEITPNPSNNPSAFFNKDKNKDSASASQAQTTSTLANNPAAPNYQETSLKQY